MWAPAFAMWMRGKAEDQVRTKTQVEYLHGNPYKWQTRLRFVISRAGIHAALASCVQPSCCGSDRPQYDP